MIKTLNTKEALLEFIKAQENLDAVICCIIWTDKDSCKAQTLFIGRGIHIANGMDAIAESFENVAFDTEPGSRMQ
jgi:hypothetical protein